MLIRNGIKMNSRERVLAVLNHKIPDRVPVFELAFDESVLKRINPNISYYDFCVQAELDIINVGLDHDFRVLDKKNGITKNEWGVIRKKTREMISVPIDGPIKSINDLKGFKPPDPTNLNRFKTLKKVVERYKDKKIICLDVHDSFNIPWYLRGGIDKYMIDYYDNPILVKELVKITIEHFAEVIKIGAKLGADIIVFGDDYAYNSGLIMSPKDFERFIFPGLSSLVEEVKKQGLYSIKHSDGNIMQIMDMIISTGIDALHPIDPSAGMDIVEINKKYADKIVVCGNVDCGYILSSATTNEVKSYTKDLIKKVSPGGRHIISSSNSIISSVKPENYQAMLNTVKEYGGYPIDI